MKLFVHWIHIPKHNKSLNPRQKCVGDPEKDIEAKCSLFMQEHSCRSVPDSFFFLSNTPGGCLSYSQSNIIICFVKYVFSTLVYLFIKQLFQLSYKHEILLLLADWLHNLITLLLSMVHQENIPWLIVFFFFFFSLHVWLTVLCETVRVL